jgi:hypothetical protein
VTAPAGPGDSPLRHRDLEPGALMADLERLAELLLTLRDWTEGAARPDGDGWTPPGPLAVGAALAELNRIQAWRSSRCPLGCGNRAHRLGAGWSQRWRRREFPSGRASGWPHLHWHVDVDSSQAEGAPRCDRAARTAAGVGLGRRAMPPSGTSSAPVLRDSSGFLHPRAGISHCAIRGHSPPGTPAERIRNLAASGQRLMRRGPRFRSGRGGAVPRRFHLGRR